MAYWFYVFIKLYTMSSIIIQHYKESEAMRVTG